MRTLPGFDLAYAKNIIGLNKDLSFYLATVQRDLLNWPEEQMRIEGDKDNELTIGYPYTIIFAVVSDNTDPSYYSMEIKLAVRNDKYPPLGKEFGENGFMNRIRVDGLPHLTVIPFRKLQCRQNHSKSKK